MTFNNLGRMWAFILVVTGVFASAAAAGKIDGLVTNLSGRTGRVHLSLKSNNGGGETGLGASVLPNGSEPTPYTISGVADGSYSLSCYLDTSGTGLRHTNDPSFVIGQVSVSGGSGSAGSISLLAPASTSFGTTLLPPTIVPAQGGVLYVVGNLS